MTEFQEQECLFKWAAQPSIREQYPELKFLFHIQNENPDAKRRAISNRGGVKKGVPDLFLPVPYGKYHGLWIEMKSMTGRASTEQIWWIDHLNANGYHAVVCRGWQEASEVILWYLNQE